MEQEEIREKLDEIKRQLHEIDQELIVVKKEEVENEEKQSYKELYELQEKKNQQQFEEGFEQQNKINTLERENIELTRKVEKQKKENEAYGSETLEEIREFIKKVVDSEIIIKDVIAENLDNEEIKASQEDRKIEKNELADRPGIYEGRRPSFFTAIGKELNKNNEAQKVTQNTKSLLRDKLMFWKKEAERPQTEPEEEKKMRYEAERKKQIMALINEKNSNEERYLKYMLLTPGIGKDYTHILNNAAEIGLDARVVISLLEQPVEMCNKDTIEAYVSRAHRGTEYNHRKELAKELIDGSWYVTAEMNGKRERFQLAPMSYLENIEKMLRHLEEIFQNKTVEENITPEYQEEDIWEGNETEEAYYEEPGGGPEEEPNFEEPEIEGLEADE